MLDALLEAPPTVPMPVLAARRDSSAMAQARALRAELAEHRLALAEIAGHAGRLAARLDALLDTLP